MTTSLLELDDVFFAHGDTVVLDRASLVVAPGERVAVLGSSGSGKTTILRLLAGLIVPDRGRVIIGGLTAAADGRLVVPPERREIGMVFQDLALWPHLSVRGNIELGLRSRGVARKPRRSRIEAVLELVELTGLGSARPAELSGGQQQRVALARALVLEPRALLMDEPLSSLDPELAQRLTEEIVRLQGRLGFALVHVTHDREEARRIATRTFVVDEGRIVDAPS